MTRTILAVVLIVFLNILVGCNSVDSGKAQLVRTSAKESLRAAAVAEVSSASETDIVERMAINRQAYREGLVLLLGHYTQTGNDMKSRWAEKELAALDDVPQYNYIIEAGVAGPNLKASTFIPEADALYYDALAIEGKAARAILVKNRNYLRRALDKYNQLIRQYPSSDKIDDAAFKAGGIYEDYKDYSIAVLYYKRAYQWDPRTVHPARFKAAFVLDRRLHRRTEAAELYQAAIEKESQHEKNRKFAEQRISELMRSEEAVE